MANWYTDQLDNRNFLSPIGFLFLIEKAKKVSFLCQKASIPTLSLGKVEIPTAGRVSIPIEGNVEYGDLEVDYQDTSNDFWPIFNEYNPIAVITFSRGYMDQSWELEFNAYNRFNWINDFTAPFQPTPSPPDTDESVMYERNSNLPINEIIESIDNLNMRYGKRIINFGVHREHPGFFERE